MFRCSTTDIGPASLPPGMLMQQNSYTTSDPNRTPIQQESCSPPVSNVWQRTQGTCDSLVQTEISIVHTPQQDGGMAMRPSTVYLTNWPCLPAGSCWTRQKPRLRSNRMHDR